MIILLSPAKTFNKIEVSKSTNLVFPDETKFLFNKLNQLNLDDLKKVLKTSDKLTADVYNYYQSEYINKYLSSKLYGGQAFKFLNASSIKSENLNNLYILSAYYGLVNGNSAISKYRLDIKDKLLDISLKDYWYQNINNYLKNRYNNKTIINLSSGEYSSLLDLNNKNIITINFGVIKDDKLVQQSMLIKKMRGMCANYLLTNNISSLSELKDINLDGFKYNDDYSNNNLIMFTK